MGKWIVGSAALLAASVAAAWLCAADNATDDVGFKLPPGVRRVDGRVKDIDLKLKKIAVEVEVDPDKPVELVIFLLTSDTKVRERENAKSLDDIRKGNPVLVFYKPAAKKGELATAVFIRLLESVRDWPGGRRPRLR